MAWLHTWAGLLPGWLLYLVFLFGAASFFQQEISAWMRPELQTGWASNASLDRIAQRLSEIAPDAENWRISLPNERGGEPVTVSWEALAGDTEERIFDPVTSRELVIRETEGGYFLYRFHFELYAIPVMWARMFVSIAALAMLVAILSGIVTHKKIFADFFMLRFSKGQRSWLDAHNVTAVLALPFHLMITYTGLVTLLFTLMPWPLDANFPSHSAYYRAAFPSAPEREVHGRANMLAPSALMERARYGLGEVRLIMFHNPGKAGAIAEIWSRGERIGDTRLATYLDAASGDIIQRPPHHGPAFTTQNVMIDLHEGLFAATALRWLYFLSGVGGTVMIATGLVLWTVKRRAKLPDPVRPYFGFRLVERLNIGVIVGSMTGIAVYFLANRLLSLTMANRADWEINSLFIAWGGIFIWTLARPAKRAWVETLTACATLYALVPLINVLTTTRGLIPSLIAQDWVYAGFDGVMLATAAVCAFTAYKVAVYKPKAASRGKPRVPAQMVT